MARLIDADALYDKAESKYKCASGNSRQIYRGLLNDIADAPTVDAVPVVHGWIPVTERLPEVGKQVLTVDKWGHIRNRKLYAYMSGHLDFQPDGLKPGADIIYWADIPEPPEGWVYSTYSYPCYQRKPKPPKGE